MAYVTLVDIRSAIPQLQITGASKPSETEVDSFIAETEAYVNAVLKNLGYTTPVAGVSALQIVREIVRAGVLARTLQARDLGVRDPELGGGAAMQRKFDRMIERLQDRKDPLNLDDDSRQTIAKTPRYSRSQVMTDETEHEPDFTTSTEF